MHGYLGGCLRRTKIASEGLSRAFFLRSSPRVIGACTGALLLLLANMGCVRDDAPFPAAVATAFVTAVNRGDIEKIIALCAQPLHVRQQAWETARDGSGFVLAKARDSRLTNPDQIRQFFAEPSNRLTVQVETSDTVQASLLSDELRGQESIWQDLSIQLFRRGMGDVEHVFAVGIDGKHKVAAIYMN